MLFRVTYTLDAESSSARWTPLVGREIEAHHPRADRLGDVIVDSASFDDLVEKMGLFSDVRAFGVNPLAGNTKE